MKVNLKFVLLFVCCLATMTVAAKKYPVIKFEKTTIDFGTFSQDEPVKTCVFKFRNVGKAKLVINYVHTTCGCTVAEYTKDFISPGGSGEIKITYDGTGKFPGKFSKYIQVFTNCKDDLSRIKIQGDMVGEPIETLQAD